MAPHGDLEKLVVPDGWSLTDAGMSCGRFRAVDGVHIGVVAAGTRLVVRDAAIARVVSDVEMPSDVLDGRVGLVDWIGTVLDAEGIQRPPESVLEELADALAQHLASESGGPPIDVSAQHEKYQRVGSRFRSLANDFATGVPEADWLLPGLVARGAMTFLGGYIGAGKTPLTLRAMGALLTGESFLGFDPPNVPADFRIVYLTQEAEGTFLPAAAEAGLNSPGLGDRWDTGYFHDFAQVDWPEVVDAARGMLDGRGLLVVDTHTEWAQVSDEDDAAQVTQALRPLAPVIGDGNAVWVTGHTVKTFEDVRDSEVQPRHIRGSGAVISNASMILTYKSARPKQTGDARHLKVVRTRFPYPWPMERYTVMEDGDLRERSQLEVGAREVQSSSDRILHYLRDYDGKASKEDVKRDLGLSGSTFATALEALKDQVEEGGKGVRGDPKRLALTQPDD